MAKVPLTELAEFRTLAPYYYDWLAHPNYDDYWAKVDVEAQFERIKAPALVSGAWGDLFAIGSVRSFEGMRTKAATPAARAGTMLVMESAGHGGPGVVAYRGEAAGGETDSTLRDLQRRFYDHYVKGIDNGIQREPRVHLFVQVPPDSGSQGSGFGSRAIPFRCPARRNSFSTCAAAVAPTRGSATACSTASNRPMVPTTATPTTPPTRCRLTAAGCAV